MSIFSEGKLVFPRDEGRKDTLFDWWYLTAHLVSESEKRYDYTLAYISRNSSTMTRQTSITDEQNKTYYGQLIDGSFSSKKRSLTLKYLNSAGDKDSWYQKEIGLFKYWLHTEIHDLFDLTINLSANKPPIVHGPQGIIQMGRGGPSFYYSQTNLALEGTFTHDGIKEHVNGIAWIDRQWGSWNEKGYGGWEWFAIQLNDNVEIMLYLFYDIETGTRLTPFLSVALDDGTVFRASNTSEFSLDYLSFWKIPNCSFFEAVKKCGHTYFSSGWRLIIPKCNIHLIITPSIPNQMVGATSWEGSCSVKGKRNGTAINGVATVELTHRFGARSPLRWVGSVMKKLPFMQKLKGVMV